MAVVLIVSLIEGSFAASSLHLLNSPSTVHLLSRLSLLTLASSMAGAMENSRDILGLRVRFSFSLVFRLDFLSQSKSSASISDEFAISVLVN